MTQHEDEARLHHMLDHAKEAVAMTTGKQKEDLQRERMLELALCRKDSRGQGFEGSSLN
jgi:hypothetical protein